MVKGQQDRFLLDRLRAEDGQRAIKREKIKVVENYLGNQKGKLK